MFFYLKSINYKICNKIRGLDFWKYTIGKKLSQRIQFNTAGHFTLKVKFYCKKDNRSTYFEICIIQNIFDHFQNPL